MGSMMDDQLYICEKADVCTRSICTHMRPHAPMEDCGLMSCAHLDNQDDDDEDEIECVKVVPKDWDE